MLLQIKTKDYPAGRYWSPGRPQDVPYRSYFTIPGTSRSRGRSYLTSKRRPWEVDSGRPHDVLRTSPTGPKNHVLETMWGHVLNVPNSFYFYFETCLIDQIYKSNSIHKVYLEHNGASKMEGFFCEIS